MNDLSKLNCSECFNCINKTRKSTFCNRCYTCGVEYYSVDNQIAGVYMNNRKLLIDLAITINSSFIRYKNSGNESIVYLLNNKKINNKLLKYIIDNYPKLSLLK